MNLVTMSYQTFPSVSSFINDYFKIESGTNLPGSESMYVPKCHLKLNLKSLDLIRIVISLVSKSQIKNI